MEKKSTIKFNKKDMKLLAIIALLIVAITFIFSVVTTSQVYAEERGYTEIGYTNFDNTNVLEDLLSAENFDIKQYPINKSLDTFIAQNFVEYCYSFDEKNRGNYSLYLYLYNPSLIELDTTSYDNKIQLAVGYDSEGKPNNYEKFNLTFCSVSDGDYKRLFYKFKVQDHRSSHDQKTIAERVNSNARQYDITGVELLTNGQYLSVDYPINKSYTYTGYAVGYGIDGNNVESTLNCNVEKLSTIKLNVEHTFFRTETSSKGADWKNQIDTVYFAVHNDYFKNDANLQRIKAEWYEYKTKPIIVTENEEFFNAIFPFRGQQIGSYEKALGIYNHLFKSTSYNKDVLDYGFGTGWTLNGYGIYPNYELVWNVPTDTLTEKYMTILYYALKCKNIENYDPYSDKIDNEFKNELYKYILTYTKTYNNGRLPIKNGNISADLFESDIDDNRKVDNVAGKIQQGYSFYDFDADLDIKHLNSWQSTNPTFWDNWKEYGLWDTLWGNIPQEETIDLSPIVIFNYDDLKLGDDELIKKYFINVKDIGTFRTYARTAQSNNEKVVLFRFATSDYFVQEAYISKGIMGVQTKHQAYLAQQSVFFNFDIIQLTFKQGDTYTVIPVVSSPIDIVNDPTPPSDIKPDNKISEWFKKILTWILIIVALMIIIKVIIWIVNAIPKKQKVVIKSDSNNGHKKRWKHRE